MKKLLLSVLAISALVACSKSDVIEMPQSQAIKFGSAFVDNSTKAIDPTWQHTAANASFKVWGKLSTTNGSTNIFRGLKVTKSGTGIGNTWYYSEDRVQYWIPSVDYSFAAIAGKTSSVDVDAADGMPTTISYDAATQSDLLYASATAIGKTSANQEVKFTFSHLLSRAQFKFVNAYPEQSDLYIQVSDIKINDAYKSGSYAINTNSWTATDNSYDLVFGNGVTVDETGNGAPIYVGSNEACYSNKVGLLVPATYDNNNATTDIPEFKLSFKVEVFLKQVIAGATEYTKINALTQDFTTDNLVPDGPLTFDKNCSYNFVITVGKNDLEPIKFGLEKVEYWTPTTPDTNIGI